MQKVNRAITSVLKFEQQPNSWRPSVYSLSDWASGTEGHQVRVHSNESTYVHIYVHTYAHTYVHESTCTLCTLLLLRVCHTRQCLLCQQRPQGVWCKRTGVFSLTHRLVVLPLYDLHCCLCMTCMHCCLCMTGRLLPIWLGIVAHMTGQNLPCKCYSYDWAMLGKLLFVCLLSCCSATSTNCLKVK